jgi:hypothetical protein
MVVADPQRWCAKGWGKAQRQLAVTALCAIVKNIAFCWAEKDHTPNESSFWHLTAAAESAKPELDAAQQ